MTMTHLTQDELDWIVGRFVDETETPTPEPEPEPEPTPDEPEPDEPEQTT